MALMKMPCAVGSGNGDSYQAYGNWGLSHSESWSFSANTIVGIFIDNNNMIAVCLFNPDDMSGCWIFEAGQQSNNWWYRNDTWWTRNVSIASDKKSVTMAPPDNYSGSIKGIIALTDAYPTSIT